MADVNNTNIKKVRGAYGLYMQVHGLQGPKDEASFMDFLKSNKGARAALARMDVEGDQIDAMFISERDGQPFQIRYGLMGLGDHPIVFEAAGVDGKKLVAYRPVRELDAEQAQAIWESDEKIITDTQELPSSF